jgi:hypothetical protein
MVDGGLINNASEVLTNFFLGFLLGFLPFLIVFKGFLIPYLSVRFGSNKFLLRVHSKNDVLTFFRVGKRQGENIVFKDNKEERIVTLAEGVIRRSLGVNWIDVNINDTLPYSFTRVQVISEAVKDDEGNERLVPRIIAFLGWDDAEAIMVAIKTALLQPRKSFSLNFDLKKVLIVIGIAVLAFIFISKKLQEGGGNVI